MFLGNPCGSEAVLEAMRAGRIGYIDTPAQSQHRPAGVTWCLDNGAYSDKFDEGAWWRYAQRHAGAASSCLFAVAPDVVGDAAATEARSTPWLAPLRELGYPVAYVAQDGLELLEVPWSAIDCLFVGGSTEWKLGEHARRLVAEARTRGKWAHMGRVNSARRWRYAEAIGCDSVDGTILTRGPDINLKRVLSWSRDDTLFPVLP